MDFDKANVNAITVRDVLKPTTNNNIDNNNANGKAIIHHSHGYPQDGHHRMCVRSLAFDKYEGLNTINIEGAEEEEEEEEEAFAPKANAFSCKECQREFPSNKSLYGHLRSHPLRTYRGANPPKSSITNHNNNNNNNNYCPPFVAPSLTANWSVKGLRGRKGLITEATAARILMMLASGEQPSMNDNVISTTNEDGDVAKKTKGLEMLPIGSGSSPRRFKKRIFMCSLCKKVFPTYQALGGHTSSHKRIDRFMLLDGHPLKKLSYNNDRNGRGFVSEGKVVAPKNGVFEYDGTNIRDGQDFVSLVAAMSDGTKHKCDLCGMGFPTGQALGGHKRRHFNGVESLIACARPYSAPPGVMRLPVFRFGQANLK